MLSRQDGKPARAPARTRRPGGVQRRRCGGTGRRHLHQGTCKAATDWYSLEGGGGGCRPGSAAHLICNLCDGQGRVSAASVYLQCRAGVAPNGACMLEYVITCDSGANGCYRCMQAHVKQLLAGTLCRRRPRPRRWCCCRSYGAAEWHDDRADVRLRGGQGRGCEGAPGSGSRPRPEAGGKVGVRARADGGGRPAGLGACAMVAPSMSSAAAVVGCCMSRPAQAQRGAYRGGRPCGVMICTATSCMGPSHKRKRTHVTHACTHFSCLACLARPSPPIHRAWRTRRPPLPPCRAPRRCLLPPRGGSWRWCGCWLPREPRSTPQARAVPLPCACLAARDGHLDMSSRRSYSGACVSINMPTKVASCRALGPFMAMAMPAHARPCTRKNTGGWFVGQCRRQYEYPDQACQGASFQCMHAPAAVTVLACRCPWMGGRWLFAYVLALLAFMRALCCMHAWCIFVGQVWGNRWVGGEWGVKWRAWMRICRRPGGRGVGRGRVGPERRQALGLGHFVPHDDHVGI